MLALYSNILYLAAIFLVVSVAAIVGLWQYNASDEKNVVRPITLSTAARASLLQARHRLMQDALEAKRAKRAEYRKSLKAGEAPAQKIRTAEEVIDGDEGPAKTR